MLNELGRLLPQMDIKSSPPHLAMAVYGLVEKYAGINPFREEKKKANKIALNIYPQLVEMIRRSSDPLLTALKIAAVGNIIDLGAYDFDIENFDLIEEINKHLAMDFYTHNLVEFQADLETAQTILYIGDNAGEIVFDKALIKLLRSRDKKIIFAVRGKPVINDVTLEDAEQVGIGQYAEVIDSGVPAPGCILFLCSQEFQQLFQHSDLVISKGQGNFEALDNAPRSVYFLFKVKCKVLSTNLSVPQDSMVFIKSNLKS
ncbi:MAG: hypothetical protein APR63_03260 [Desulfuromonas sp. SDB]|nr:MAG: hypothetical protein APR63_03260 [Desulfuromonas sp. SDB]